MTQLMNGSRRVVLGMVFVGVMAGTGSLLGALAGVILVVAGAGSFQEFRAAEDIAEPTSNEYAIADTAIEDEFYQ